MTSPFNLEDIEKEILASTPQSDAPFCCCTLLDSSLGADEHLPDCELLLIGNDIHQRTPSDEQSDASTSSGPSEFQAAAQRRRHRETVARIRHRMRVSIAGLRAQQIRLEEELRATITSVEPTTNAQSLQEASGTAELIRVAYFDLVREQIELQDERTQLEATRLLREKYERLVQREVEKARMLGTNQPFPGA